MLTSVDASVDLAIFHSVFRQTFPKIVINNTEFVATSFVRLFSVHNLLISNTTFDQQTKSDVSLIFVTSGNLMLIDNSSLSYFPVGQAIKKSDYQYVISRNRSKFITGLTFSCKECDYNFYSLQRGTARGEKVEDGFQCLPCPRGADCVPAIKSKTNYWG